MVIDLKNRQGTIYFTLLIIISLVLTGFVMNQFHPSDTYTIGDDASFHFRRFVSIANAIESGAFPFYIDFDALNSYGYAYNLFYPDMLLIPFAFLVNILGVVTAYKLMIVSAFILCSALTYLSANGILKNRNIAFIIALLYTFSFYRLVDMSLRTALGEYLAFTFIPLVFWGCYEIVMGNYKRRWWILSLGFAGMLFSHVISTLMVFIVACLFIIISIRPLLKEPIRILYFILAAILTLLLTAVFLLPMMEQLNDNTFYFQTSPFVGEIHFQAKTLGLTAKGLIKEFFLDGNTNKMYADRFIGIGFMLTLPLLARLFVKDKNSTIRFADISTIVGVVLLIAVSNIFPWQIVPFSKLAIIQFPWRFLQIISFLWACSGAIYLCSIFKSQKAFYSISAVIIIGILISVSVSATAFKSVKTEYFTNESYNLSAHDNLGIGLEYLPSAIPDPKMLTENDVIIKSENQKVEISNVERLPNGFSFSALCDTTEGKVILPLTYYKGYITQIGKESAFAGQSPEGLVQVSCPTSGDYTVVYAGILVQKISWLISIISLITLLLYLIYQAKRKRL